MQTLDFERGQSVWLSAAPESTAPAEEAVRLLERVLEQQARRHEGRLLAPAESGATPGVRVAAFRAMEQAVLCAVAVQRDLAAAERDGAPGARLRCRMGINRGDHDSPDLELARGDRAFLETLRAAAEPGGLCLSATAGHDITRNIPREALLDEAPPARNRLALGLQSALLLGYFLFWSGLIIWRNWYVAVHKVAPCWPSFLCD